MPKLLLIDGHSQAYRAYFGMKAPLTTRSGEPTGAIFGFARKLLSVLKEYQPEHVAVAFDVGDTWRHEEFPDYKATRERMPDDLRDQITRIYELLEAFNIPIVTYDGYEADDVLGTLSKQADEQGTDVLILTGDRDLFQLVSDRVQILYTPGGPRPKTVCYGPAEVEERFGLNLEQFIELKAITGDNSDNIPGVPGVGDKTATKFLIKYGTIENLYAHIDEISGPKTRQNLIDTKDQVFINKRLVTITTDLDMKYDPEATRLQDFDLDKVIAFLTEMEFTSLIKQLPEAGSFLLGAQGDTPAATATGDSGQLGLFDDPSANGSAAAQSTQAARGSVDAKSAVPQVDFLCVQNEEALQKLVDALTEAERISFDVETTSTDAMQAKLVGLGIAWAKDQLAYIPVAHTNEGKIVAEQLDWETKILPAIQPFFADPKITMMAHNAKYDLTVCKRHGLEINGWIHDTMVMAWVLDPGNRRLGLKGMADVELGMEMVDITELIGSGRKQVTIDTVDIQTVGAYCAQDVNATIQLFDLLKPRLDESGMGQLYNDLELPMIPVLTDMEMTGIGLDKEFLAAMSVELTDRLNELEGKLFSIVGREFNQRSTQQLSDVLFNDMAFPTKGMKKTKSGHYSTAAAEMERLSYADLSAEQAEVLEIISEQRQLEKLRGTYVDALPELVHPETGRLHTSFNQAGAVTGRMSSNNPNLQNIPIRTELGRQVRKAFIAREGWILLAADYSQVELRVLAHISQDPKLLDAFRNDLDIHSATASALFGVDLDAVTKDQRSMAKMINFATIYGVSAFGLSSRTEMGPKEAQIFLDQYFETYPRVHEYIGNTLQMAAEEGYVETLSGRKRFFAELQGGSLSRNQRNSVERAAMNAPIQGTSADITKIAMLDLFDKLQQSDLQAKMLLQVHDELVLECPPEEKEATAKLVRDTMESAYTLDVPLRVDVECGVNWYDLEEIPRV